MKVSEFSLKGIGPFKKEVTVKVEKGLTCIYGANLSKGGNANAVGKTLLTSTIREIFYPNDKDKGSRSITFDHKGRKVEVTRGSKLQIKVDGEDKTKRTKTQTQEFLERVWPISELDYATYGMLDLLPHPLLRGTSAERKSFFNRFFRFSEIDQERKIVTQALADVKAAKSAIAEIDTALDSIPEIEVSDSDIAKAKKNLKQASDMQDAYLRAKANKDLRKLADGLDIDNFEETLKNLRVVARKHQHYESFKLLYEEYLESRKTYLSLVEKRKTDLSLEELEKASRLYERNIDKAESELMVIDNLKPEVKVKGDRDAVVGELAGVREQLVHVKKHRKGKCYACGSAVVVDEDELLERLEQLEEKLERHDLADKVNRFNLRVIEDNKQAEIHNLEVKKARKIVKENKDAAFDYDILRTLKKPTKVEKPVKVDFDENLYRRYLEAEHRIEAIREALKSDDTELVEADVPKFAARLAKLEADKAHKDKANEQRALLLKRRSKFEKVVANEKHLKILKVAYSDKGIRAMAADIITAHLMKTINHYASGIFDEYRFGFDLKKMQFKVTRDSGETTSVTKLSGAETKLLTFIIALSLLQFVPKDKRLNVLILDEPGASMSEQTKELFNVLLKEMLKVIETIIIVTPGKEEYENAKNFTVERTSKGSILREGKP